MELHRTDEGFALYKEKITDRLLRAHARRKGGCHHRVWHRTAVAAQRLRLLSIKETLRAYAGYDRETATVFTAPLPADAAELAFWAKFGLRQKAGSWCAAARRT